MFDAENSLFAMGLGLDVKDGLSGLTELWNLSQEMAMAALVLLAAARLNGSCQRWPAWPALFLAHPTLKVHHFHY